MRGLKGKSKKNICHMFFYFFPSDLSCFEDELDRSCKMTDLYDGNIAKGTTDPWEELILPK